MLTKTLEKTLHRSLAFANERRHEYATLEHLLLALTYDNDTVDIFAACKVDLEKLRHELTDYLDNELENLVSNTPEDAKPTASFQRTLQRAAIHVQSAGSDQVAGSSVLVAMFAESQSHAVAHFLATQGMTRLHVVDYMQRRLRKMDPPAVVSVETMDSPGVTIYAEPRAVVTGNRPLPSSKAIPAQVKSASTFSRKDGGPIDLVLDPPKSRRRLDAQQRELFDEMVRKASALGRAGSNALGSYFTAVSAFSECLAPGFRSISVARVWSRGNTLRRCVAADARARKTADPFTPPLPEEVGERLVDLVETFNAFILNDQKGFELDSARLGPQELGSAKAAIAPARAMIRAVAAAPKVVSRSAADTVAEQLDAASAPGTDLNNDLATRLARDSAANLVAELIRAAYLPLRKALAAEGKLGWKGAREGFYRAVGGGAAVAVGGSIAIHWNAFAEFVAQNSDVFRSFIETAFTDSALTQIVDLLVGLLAAM